MSKGKREEKEQGVGVLLCPKVDLKIGHFHSVVCPNYLHFWKGDMRQIIEISR